MVGLRHPAAVRTLDTIAVPADEPPHIHNEHGVDPVGAVLLVADLLVLLGVVLLLLLRPGPRRRVPSSPPPVVDDGDQRAPSHGDEDLTIVKGQPTMAHISLPVNLFGIVGPLARYPATGRALRELTETLLRGPSPLSAAERELIAAYVSDRNECRFCAGSHAAAARALLGTRSSVVDDVLAAGERAQVEARLAALLAIADKVRVDGRAVTPADVAAARDAGADDQAIHDTVLIAAAFCMFNRYVDGLATPVPSDPATYHEMGANLAESGYLAATTGRQAM